MPTGMTIATALGIIVTIVGNVPINLRTGHITEETAPKVFIAMRRRWDVFKIVRASLQLIGAFSTQ